MKQFILMIAVLLSTSTVMLAQQITNKAAFDNAGAGSWFEVYTQSSPGLYFNVNYLDIKVSACSGSKVKLDFYTANRSTQLDWFSVALDYGSVLTEAIEQTQFAPLIIAVRDASCGTADYQNDVQNYLDQYNNSCWKVACVED